VVETISLHVWLDKCSGLTNVTIPYSFNHISLWMFYKDAHVKSVKCVVTCFLEVFSSYSEGLNLRAKQSVGYHKCQHFHSKNIKRMLNYITTLLPPNEFIQFVTKVTNNAWVNQTKLLVEVAWGFHSSFTSERSISPRATSWMSLRRVHPRRVLITPS